MARDLFAEIGYQPETQPKASEPRDLFAEIGFDPTKVERAAAAPPPATGRGGRSANQPSRAASTPDLTPASGRSGKKIAEPRKETYNGEEIVDRPDRVGRVSSPMLDQIMGSGGGTAQDLVDRYHREQITGSNAGGISAPRGPAPSVGSVARGLGTSFVQGAVQAKSGIEQASNDFLPLAPWETPEMRASQGRKLEQEGAAAGDKIAQSTPEFETDTERGLYGGAASLAQMAPGIAASVATGNPLPGIAAASVQTGAQAYDKYKQRGATPGEAALGATLEGTVEGVGEMLPMGTIVAKFGKTGAKKFLSEFFIQEMGTEQATTLAQDAIDTAIANPDKTWGDYLKERPDAAYQTALGVLVMSGALGTASAGANYAANRLDERGRIANRNPADTRTPPPGIRETAEQEAAIVTPEDEASPLDTADIVAGRVEIAKAEAGSTADGALGAVGLPKVGTPVAIDYGDGTVEFGTMRDTFEDETGSGVIIDRESGRPLREYHDTLTDAGVRITPRDAAGVPEITVPVVAEPTPKVAAAPQQTAAPKATGPTSPSSNVVAVIKSIFGDKARVTSGYRGPDHPLSKKNPRSWHAKSHAAVDVAPIPGMTFEQAKARIEAQGYSLIEAINEVGKGRTKHATGDHWHFVIGEKGAAGPAAVPGAGDGLASVPAPTPSRDVEPLELAQPDFDRIDAGPIDNEWNKFADESGTLNVPRSDMPQIKAEHRGAMVNFLNARGIDHEEQTVAARDLKPTQAEFSPAKVQKAKDFTGGNRAILVSSDGHVVDGHHQWLAARDQGEDIRTIRLNAPIRDLLNVVPEFPSAEVDKGSTAPARPAESTVEVGDTLAGGMPVAKAAAVARGDATPAPRSQVSVVDVNGGKSVAVMNATPDDLARVAAAIPNAKKPLRRKDGALVYNVKYAGQIRAVLAGRADDDPAPAWSAKADGKARADLTWAQGEYDAGRMSADELRPYVERHEAERRGETSTKPELGRGDRVTVDTPKNGEKQGKIIRAGKSADGRTIYDVDLDGGGMQQAFADEVRPAPALSKQGALKATSKARSAELSAGTATPKASKAELSRQSWQSDFDAAGKRMRERLDGTNPEGLRPLLEAMAEGRPILHDGDVIDMTNPHRAYELGYIEMDVSADGVRSFKITDAGRAFLNGEPVSNADTLPAAGSGNSNSAEKRQKQAKNGGQAGNSKTPKSGPVDMLKFIARAGGIAYDGLNEQSRREGAKGHDLRNTGALATFVPGAGPLLRPNGLSLDQIGEKLWEAGYFGSPEVTPRPDENAVLRALEDVTRTKEKRYSSFDDAPVPAPSRNAQPQDDADATTAQAMQVLDARQAWDEGAARLGLPPLFQQEIDRFQGEADAVGVPPLAPDETDPDVILQHLIELANRNLDDARADAFYEVEDDYYQILDDDFRRAAAEDQGRGEGVAGQAIEPRDTPAQPRGDEDGAQGSRTDGEAGGLDNGAAVDPAIAERQRKEAQLRAEAPLRGQNRTGQAQDGTMGLGLFDTADQPEMDLSAPQSKPGQKEKAQEPAPSQPVEPTDEAGNQEPGDREAPSGPIDDFGEKLVGARKDTWQSFRDRMADAKKEDVTAVPLSKSWPEPDYQQLLDSGADRYAVAAMRAMRDAIPTKPRSYGVVAWGKQVEALRDTAEKMIDDAGLAENFTRKLTTEFSRSLRDLQGAIDLYMEFGHERSFKGITFGSHHYSLYRGEQNVTKWTVEQKQKATAFSNWPRELAVADTREEALAKFKALLANGGLDKKPAVVRFDIYSRTGKPGFWIGKKVGKTTADLKWFETVKEARAFKVEHYDDLVSMLDSYKDIPPERKEVNSPRVGINHRNGADVTPDQFMETFGFRGVQFGNYVEGARRQEDLNEAYDALMDLAGVLGIPAKALSLNGTLGLAFGARGKGGKNAAMAHFEPGNIVINLTKKQGAGSLAHEWWHGLDNYFARQRGNGNFVTETTGRPAGEMRQEMADAFKAVMTAIKQTAIKQRSRELDKRRTKDYWSTDIEMSARAFESYVIAKLQDEQFSNDYLANIVSEKAWAIEGAYPYPVASEIAAIRAGFDGFFQAIESKQDGDRVPLYSLPREGDDLPTVTIGDEGWGPLPKSGKGRMNALRQRVGRWYNGLLGSTVQSSDGRTVRFVGTGLDKTLRGGEDLLSLARAIPKIIEQGKLVRSEPSIRPGFVAVHRYAANVQKADGTVIPLVVLVREANNGTFHYSLNRYVDEGASNAPAAAGGAVPKNSNPAVDGRVEAEINLFRLPETRKGDAGNSEQIDAGLARLQDELSKLGLANKVAVRLLDTMGGANGSYLASLITVARDGDDTPIFTLHHEAVHALRDMGVFSPADWALLVAKAKRTPGMMRQINRRYLPMFKRMKMTAAEIEDAINEEAVADMFAMWQRGDYQAKGTIERLFQRLRGILDAIKRAFGQQRERTGDDVLGEIADGTMGAKAKAFTSGGARGQARPTFGRKLSSADLDMSSEARQARAIAQGFLTEAAWQEMKGGRSDLPEDFQSDGRMGDLGDTGSPAQKAGRDERGIAEDRGLADADRSGLATFYHGTSDRIGAFALDHPNRKDNGWLGRGVYLTDDPALARFYADRKGGADKPKVMELHARLSNPYRATLATKQELRRASTEQVAKWTEDRIAEGHDGSILIYPDGTAEIAVFDPANLREPDAAFDPEQRDSANLKFSLPDLAQSGPFKRDQAADDAAEASLAGITSLLNGNKRDDDKISAALNWLRVGFQDKMVPVLRLQEAVSRQLGSDVGEKMNPYLAEETMHGRIGARLDALMEDHVQPLVEAMATANVELIDFEDYIYARHAPERNAQIAKINEAMPDGGSGMTDMEARAVMKRIERAGMTETMESLAARYDAMMAEAKQRRIDAGLLSQEEADAWDEAYEFYAPLRGRAEIEGEFDPKADARMQRSSGLSVKGKESKRAFGRRTKAADILSYAVLQAEEAIVRSEQNRVGNAFLELAKTIGDGDILTINKVERRRRLNPTTGLVEFYTVNQLTAEDAPYTISTKVDGTEHRITMNRANPQAVAIADAMRNLSAVRFELLVRTAGKLTRFFSAVNTRFSPPFIITNAIRDVMTAATTLQQYEDMPGLTRDVLRDWRKALVAGRRGNGEWAKWRREWELAGGKVAFNQMVDFEGMRERMHKDIARVRHPNDLKRIAGRFFEAVETVNDAIERAVRLSVYANARKRGVSKAKAASMSLNVTVNFTRKGQFGPAMNSGYAFFNASTQGSATLIFAAMRSKKVRRTMFGFVLLGFALDMINAMMAGDDDDGESYWDKMPEWEKSRNLILMLPGGDYIKLPLAYGLNALYGLGRNASAVGRGGMTAGEALSGSLLEFADAFNPVGGGGTLWNLAAPTAVDPLVDVSANKDFTGRPIQPEDNPFASPETPSNNYFPTVSVPAKWLAQTLNDLTGGDEVLSGTISVSPEVLEYAFGYITGGAGRFVEDNVSLATAPLDPEAELTVNDVPMVDRLTGTYPEWLDKSLYYDRAHETRDKLDHVKDYVDLGKEDKARAYLAQHPWLEDMAPIYKAAEKEMKRIRKDKREVNAAHELGELTDAQHREGLKIIKADEDNVVLQFNTAWNIVMDRQEQSNVD